MPRSRRTVAVAALLGCAGVVLALAAVVAASRTGSARAIAAGPAPRAAPAAGCTPPSPGTHLVHVTDGRVPVVLHVPPGTASERRSLVLVLPGAGQTARDIASYTGYSRLADQRGFMVAYPTATGARPFWNVSGTIPGKPDDVDYLRRVITTLTGSAACADPARVGVTGVSNGGGMSARLACDAADLLSAAAPVAGGYSTLPDCKPARPLALLEIHGLRDEVVPYVGKGSDHAGAVGPFLDRWRRSDGCTSPATRSTPAANVTELRWSCPDGRMVVHDRVVDAEHGWPGEATLRPFSSTLRTWQFLNIFVNEQHEGRAPRSG
jgi:polyhydroxybutyrate depolymerase